MNVLAVFMLGFLCGMLVIMVYGYFQLRNAKGKLDEAKKKFLNELEKETDKVQSGVKSITERLNKAQEITNQQLELLGAIDQPSKNALHSQYKNSLNAEVSRLEDEKMNLLQSILKDGYDPTLTIHTGNKSEKIKLSAYLSSAGIPAPTPDDEGPKDPNAPRRVGKFMVYNGGGNDGTTH